MSVKKIASLCSILLLSLSSCSELNDNGDTSIELIAEGESLCENNGGLKYILDTNIYREYVSHGRYSSEATGFIQAKGKFVCKNDLRMSTTLRTDRRKKEDDAKQTAPQ